MSSSTTPLARGTRAPVGSPIRRVLRSLAIRCGLYPHITMNKVAFKTFEFRELMKLSRLRKTDRVLDLGCGTGTQTIIVGGRTKQVIGVDTDPAWVERARFYRERFGDHVDVQFLLGPVEAQGLEEGSFDKVLSFCVIEHIPNHREVLSELYRILKPGGEMILSADALEGIDDPALIEKHRKDNHVFQYFRSDTFRSCLTEAGFEVTELYPIFRSEHARCAFEDGIRTSFSASYFSALFGYFRLRIHEALCRQHDRGLFLVARCRKPAE